MYFTKHALLRLSERNITKSEAIEAVMYGNSRPHRTDPDRLSIYDHKNKLILITSKDKNALITIFRAN